MTLLKSVAALIPVALFALCVSAQPASAAERTPITKKIDKPTFYVHTWSCRRSEQVVLQSDDMWKVAEAVAKAKKEGRNVAVTTGCPDDTCVFSKAARYDVYRNPCKGYQFGVSVGEEWIAKLVAAKYEKDGDAVLIVASY